MTLANSPRIPVFQGANVWRLLRTDRDAKPAAEIPQTAAAAARRWLQPDASTWMAHELIPTGEGTGLGEWRFDRARPFRVLAVSDIPMTPHADGPRTRLVADRQNIPGFPVIPTIRGQRAWYVFVQFFWRGPDTQIAYPYLRSGIFGDSVELSASEPGDWLLDKAWRLDSSPQDDPGDQTWGDAMGDRAAAAAASATDALGVAVGVGSGLLILLALWALSRK